MAVYKNIRAPNPMQKHFRFAGQIQLLSDTEKRKKNKVRFGKID